MRSLEFNLSGDYVTRPIEKQRTHFAWAVPQFNERLLRQLAGYCESVSSSSERFTYAFTFDGDVRLVEDESNFVIEGGTDGFTCATFVLALLNGIHLKLVDTNSWYNVEGDEEWQRSTLAFMVKLRNKGRIAISDETLARRVSEIPCLRYPPAAILGACRVGSHPTECGDARAAGVESLQWLDGVNEMLSRTGQ